MSDESSAEIRDARKDWMGEHRAMYLQSGGAEGHIMDLRPVGAYNFGTHCLVKYVGRKSGENLQFLFVHKFQFPHDFRIISDAYTQGKE